MSFNEGDRVRVVNYPVENDESSGIIGLEGTVLAPYGHGKPVPYPIRVHLDGELDWDVFKEEELERV